MALFCQEFAAFCRNSPPANASRGETEKPEKAPETARIDGRGWHNVPASPKVAFAGRMDW
jgi:hypothetical protein